MSRVSLKPVCLILFFLALSASTPSRAQASFLLQSKNNITQEYRTLKGYSISEQKKYAYMFSNFSVYRIRIENTAQETNQIQVLILDRNNKEVATNFDPKTKTFNHEFAFKFGKTDLYYVQFNDLTH